MHGKCLGPDVLEKIFLEFSPLLTLGIVQEVCKRWYICVAKAYKTRSKVLETKWLTEHPFCQGINMYRLTNGKTVFRVEPSIEMCRPVRILHSAFQCPQCDQWHVFKYSLKYTCPRTKKRCAMPKPFLRTKKIFQGDDMTAIILNGFQRRHASASCPHHHIKKKMRTAAKSFISTSLL